MSSDNQVDVQNLIKEFNQWEKLWIELWREKNASQDELEASKKEVLELKKKEKVHQQEIKDMRNKFRNIQKALHHSCDREDEYEVLQKRAELMKGEMSTLREKHNGEISELHKKMEEVTQVHKVQIESMKGTMLMEADEQRQTHEEEMQKKQVEYEQLQEKFKTFEREKQSELFSLRMEYESKFTKLQKQAAKIPQSNAMSTINQDIFRKVIADRD
ncbi:hypothetical protein CAPTEDRAFT_206259 [Capitella teleta]|uniref:Uncharacterized protein n=1 Tax=Capitella teleta TaxID=283909 RepID=R7U2G2_CAPTE|nr:hypothetical protein CAPTEDRAFT_206259 [Capitella teleta]|eukprot:ELU00078.1 hypothetical protein CAPTEDRAFT_206259 [Capitella teleta]